MKAKWDCEIAPQAQRDLKRLPQRVRISILSKVVSLCDGPRNSPQSKRLKGSPERFRLRIGDYRVVFTLDDEARKVRVDRVRHRREAYCGL
jgi:mRNA interferase RelE/StbE